MNPWQCYDLSPGLFGSRIQALDNLACKLSLDRGLGVLSSNRAVTSTPDLTLTSGLGNRISGSFFLSVKWAYMTHKALLLPGFPVSEFLGWCKPIGRSESARALADLAREALSLFRRGRVRPGS